MACLRGEVRFREGARIRVAEGGYRRSCRPWGMQTVLEQGQEEGVEPCW